MFLNDTLALAATSIKSNFNCLQFLSPLEIAITTLFLGVGERGYAIKAILK